MYSISLPVSQINMEPVGILVIRSDRKKLNLADRPGLYDNFLLFLLYFLRVLDIKQMKQLQPKNKTL